MSRNGNHRRQQTVMHFNHLITKVVNFPSVINFERSHTAMGPTFVASSGVHGDNVEENEHTDRRLSEE